MSESQPAQPSASRSRRPGVPRSERMPPDHLGLLLASVLLAGIGWFGLYNLVTTRLPRIAPELWLFMLLLHLAVSGTVLPFVRYLNVRLTPIHSDLPSGSVIVRQSVWVGLYIVTCAWLQIPRVLSPIIAFFLALVFIVLEIFLQSRERRRTIDDDE